jgi:membrane protease subunit HflC
MKKTLAVTIGLLLLVLFLLFSTTYSVKFNEVAIKRTFGRATEESIIREPGLHFGLPFFIDRVEKLDTRLQLVESPLEEISTADGLQVVVRAYLLWQIRTEDDGPLEFYNRYVSTDGARESLEGELRTEFTGVLSGYRFNDLLGENSRLAEAEDEIRLALESSLVAGGVQPVAVGINHVVLPSRTTEAVLNRMKATRNALESIERSKGEAEANRIFREAEAKGQKILAFADRRAEEIKALGDEQAAAIQTEMAEAPELAIFLIWLDGLEKSLTDNVTAILPAAIAPWHLMNPAGVAYEGAIPVPAESPDALAAGVAEQPEPEKTPDALAAEDGKGPEPQKNPEALIAEGGEAPPPATPAKPDGRQGD